MLEHKDIEQKHTDKPKNCTRNNGLDQNVIPDSLETFNHSKGLSTFELVFQSSNFRMLAVCEWLRCCDPAVTAMTAASAMCQTTVLWTWTFSRICNSHQHVVLTFNHIIIKCRIKLVLKYTPQFITSTLWSSL